jgi:2Fe-2S ferredoxin
MPMVTFLPSREAREVRDGSTIAAAARRTGVRIGQSCDGEGTCGECKVRVMEGDRNLSPVSQMERMLMEEKEFLRNERAACLVRIRGDVTLEIP